ncbi:MAG: VRR-NUC domain-containing protein [Burkholderiales bacterium]|nr:VRR-NUC domain-containing protein [Burkholderiales bacterium]
MHPICRRFYAIPNGGKRDRITAAIMKAEGVKAGVLDTFLPYPAHGRHGLYIEFKAGKNVMTQEQRDFAAQAIADGYAVAVAYSSDRGIKAALSYLHGADDFSQPLVLR